jgi:hypothetical protein
MNNMDNPIFIPAALVLASALGRIYNNRPAPDSSRDTIVFIEYGTGTDTPDNQLGRHGDESYCYLDSVPVSYNWLRRVPGRVGQPPTHRRAANRSHSGTRARAWDRGSARPLGELDPHAQTPEEQQPMTTTTDVIAHRLNRLHDLAKRHSVDQDDASGAGAAMAAYFTGEKTPREWASVTSDGEQRRIFADSNSREWAEGCDQAARHRHHVRRGSALRHQPGHRRRLRPRLALAHVGPALALTPGTVR